MSLTDTYDPAEDPAAPEAPPTETDEQKIARARVQGWHPFEEYRGPTERWVDWPEFLARGERELPVLRDQLRRRSEDVVRLNSQMASMQEKLDAQNAALEEMRSLARRADERGYQRALNELKGQAREAVALGDVDAFDRVNAQIEALETERAEVERPPAAPTTERRAAAPPADPAITAFVDANPWFSTDPQLRQAMVSFHTLEIQKHPAMPTADQLDRALARLKTEFPEKFGIEPAMPNRRPDDDLDEPRPRAPASLAPRGEPAAPRRRRSGWEAIEDADERREAQAAFERIKIAQPDMTEAEYLEIYNNPHSDVLAVQRRTRSAR